MTEMRKNIVHPNADSLKYAIREIVIVAQKFQKLGLEISWENIGDPIQKGEKIEPWIKDVLTEVVSDDISWGYCDTAGVPKTRQFIVEQVNCRGGAVIKPEDIVFFNGLGDGIATLYRLINSQARVLGSSPAYSTHASAEAMHGGSEHITYTRNPENNWAPDFDEIRKLVKYNKSITGILLVNPDNPTGAVYSRQELQEFVSIAQQFGLFLICDEIYCHITYKSCDKIHLSEVIEDVPAVVMRGISKEFPWPGSRCGWIEFMNRNKSPNFDRFAESILAAKRLQVCATTQPQMVIPKVMGDPRYREHLDKRSKMFEQRASEAYQALKDIPGLIATCPKGAFYMTLIFEDDAINDRQSLKIENDKIRSMVEDLVKGVSLDFRFTYYLLAATGICVVPISGFAYSRPGFRITLLECDAEKRAKIYSTLAAAIKEYLSSMK